MLWAFLMPSFVFGQLPFVIPYILVYQNVFSNCLSSMTLASLETLHGDFLAQCPPHDKQEEERKIGCYYCI